MKHLARLFIFDFNSPLQSGFFFITLFLFVGYFFQLDVNSSLNENRNLRTENPFKKAPHLNALPSEIQSHWQDHFGFRKGLIRIANLWMNTGLLSANGSVVFGKNDWLFFAKAFDPENYHSQPGSEFFSTVEYWEIQLREVSKQLKKFNKRFYVMFAPSSHLIAETELPEALTPLNQQSRANILCGKIKDLENIFCLSLSKLFLSQPDPKVFYQKTDTHWNMSGAFLAYRFFVDKLKLEVTNFNPHVLEDYKVTMREGSGGDLSLMIGKQEDYKTTNPYFELLNKNQVGFQPSIFVIRDSFFSNIEYFFNSDFKKVNTVSGNQIVIEDSTIRSNDVLLMLVTDRNILGKNFSVKVQ